MAVIELIDVSKLYGFGDATTVALDEVNLSIEKGEFVAIMGPSGSGKSTLMNLIGLLDRPTHGQYLLDDRPVAKLSQRKRAKARRDKIGFIFQSFNLLPRMNVLENVALPLAYKGMTPVRRLKASSRILTKVGLQDREYYLPNQLSGGQAQRAAIARALIANPSIIIADEPTGNLDSMSSKVVMDLLSEVHEEGNTILMVTHNPELTRYASRVIYMKDGAIINDESTKIGLVASGARRFATPLQPTAQPASHQATPPTTRAAGRAALKKSAEESPKEFEQNEVVQVGRPMEPAKKKSRKHRRGKK